MNLKEVMNLLESYGTDQNIKIWTNHGSTRDMYGVSFANQKLLKKKIKVNHNLALQLWSTGNVDAMVLATMICDPKIFTKKDLENMAKDLEHHGEAAVFCEVVRQTKFLIPLMEKWTKSKKEYIGTCGWVLLCAVLIDGSENSDEYFIDYLNYIEKNIHDSKNRIRHAMNSALIRIGMRNKNLKRLALNTAKKIGKVEVDHKKTSCKTKDAVKEIEKVAF